MTENTNGWNGNGHANGKAFDIVPHEEDLSSIAPRLRRAARMDADLTDGAKVLYDHLTDQSFLYSVSPARGVVTMSKPKLAEELKCSERSIARRRVQLQSKRYVWTRTFWRGGFELTNWYIRGMAKPQQELWDDSDPSWGSSNSKRRRGQPVRGPQGKFVRNGEGGSKSTDLPIKSGEAGQPCPAATVKIDLRSRTAVSCVAGQPCPATTVKIDLQRRTAVTCNAGQPCPSLQDKTGQLQGTAVSVYKETPGSMERESLEEALNRLGKRAGAAAPEPEPAPPAPKAASKPAKNGKPARKPGREEKEFMLLCREVFGDQMMDKEGGYWRKLYRDKPAKAQSVLLETQFIKKTTPGILKTTWWAYAVDLFKNRFDS